MGNEIFSEEAFTQFFIIFHFHRPLFLVVQIQLGTQNSVARQKQQGILSRQASTLAVLYYVLAE